MGVRRAANPDFAELDLTYAGVKSVCRARGVEMEEIRKQQPDWDPWKGFETYDELSGQTESGASLATTFDGMTLRKRELARRPAIIQSIMFGSIIEQKGMTAAEAPRLDRDGWCYLKMLEHIIMEAVKDGFVDQEWINTTMKQFGIVKDTDTEYKHLEKHSPVNISELYDLGQFVTKNSMGLPKHAVGDDYLDDCSPRCALLEHNANLSQVHFVHMRIARKQGMKTRMTANQVCEVAENNTPL
jgi:hypothetical protein